MKGQANSKPITKQKPRILKKVWVQDFLHNLLFVAFCLVVLFVFLLMFIFRFCFLFGFGYVMFTVCFWYYSCGKQIQVGRGLDMQNLVPPKRRSLFQKSTSFGKRLTYSWVEKNKFPL